MSDAIADAPAAVVGTDWAPLDGTPQADVLAAVRDPEIKLVGIEAGVGGGKTKVGTRAAIDLAMSFPGSHGFLVGPDYQMLTVDRDEFEARLDEIWVFRDEADEPEWRAIEEERVAARLRGDGARAEMLRRSADEFKLRIGWDLVRSRNKNERRYDFINDSTLWLKSATEPAKFRGFEVDWAVLDEAQKYGEGVYTMVRTRMRATRVGKIVLCATVAGKNWIYDRRVACARTDDATSAWFLWASHDNPELSRDELAYAESHIDPRVYEQEYLARRDAFASEHFEHLNELVGGEIQLGSRPASRYAIGVDLAKKQDFAVIAVLDCDRDVFVEFERFQHVPYVDETARGADGRIDIDRDLGVYGRIRRTWLRYGKPKTCVDTSGPGGNAHHEVIAKTYGVGNAEGVPTNALRKDNPIEAFIAAFKRRTVRLPQVVKMSDGTHRELPAAQFAKEARDLVCDDNGSWRKFHAPEGSDANGVRYFDDCIVGGSLAWRARGEARARSARDLSSWMRQPGLS